MRDSEMTRPLAKKASEILMKYLNNEIKGSDQIKIALSSLQTHVKMMATEANDDTNRLGLIKMIYGDKNLRETYIKKTMPYMLEPAKK